MNHFLVIGAGGIGYHLVEPLVRFLNYQQTEWCVTVVDGDTVETGNLSRQHVSSAVGRNKAEVLAETVNQRIDPKNPVQFIARFLSPGTVVDSRFSSLIKSGVTFFVCVDNNATRVFVEQLCCSLNSAAMISGGNDEYRGQAQLFVRSKGKNMTPLPSEVNPEILDLDQFPDEIGCDQQVVSEPQLIFTNNMVASSMLNLWFSQIWRSDTKTRVNEVCTNIIAASAFPYDRKSLVSS